MPFRRHLYPANWEAIVAQVRARAGGRCEWCSAVHGEPHPVTGSKVVLTTAHYPDPTPANCDLANLFSLCQRCHLGADRARHVESARKTRARRLEQEQRDLFAAGSHAACGRDGDGA